MKLTDAVQIWDEILARYSEEEPLQFKEFIDAINVVVGVENDIPAIGGCCDEEILSSTEEILRAVPYNQEDEEI